MKMMAGAGAGAAEEEKKKSQGQLQAMWFAAGTAAFMACLERAILVSFVEQWRVVVFLALNLVLLAILFTSPSSLPPPLPPSSTNDLKILEQPTSPDCIETVDLIADEEMIKKMKKFCSRDRENEQPQPEVVDIGVDNGSRQCHDSHSKVPVVKNRISRKRETSHHQNAVKVSNYKTNELSEEEFNQKVEAFIATFRQHLVSDAKGTTTSTRTKSCRIHSSSAGNLNHQHGGIAMRL